MIKAVIYDMDGVIINSEPYWREAIIYTFNSVGLPFTEDMCRITQGMRLIEVVEYWYAKTPWQGKTVLEVESNLLEKVTELISTKGNEMEGVKSSIIYFKNKGYKIALASSSASSLIDVVLDKLNIADEFEIVNSAENLAYGKPHPEIFIKTALQLGVTPNECLVIEDSFNGVLAGKSALMQVVAIPDKESAADKRFTIADYQLNNLNEIQTLNF